MTLQQLRDLLVEFCMDSPDISDEMHIFFDTTEGSLGAKYEDDEKIVSIKVLKNTFCIEQTMKEKQTYQN